MNQRVISSSSLILSKSGALKGNASSDLRRVISDPKILGRTSSNSGLKSTGAAAAGNVSNRMISSSSIKSDLSRLSSSSLSSNKAKNDLFKSSSISSMGNAAWGEAAAAKPAVKSVSNPFLNGTYEKVSRSRDRRLSSSHLLSLKEEETSEAVQSNNASWETKIGEVTASTNPFLNGTYAQAIVNRNRASLSSLASLHEGEEDKASEVPSNASWESKVGQVQGSTNPFLDGTFAQAPSNRSRGILSSFLLSLEEEKEEAKEDTPSPQPETIADGTWEDDHFLTASPGSSFIVNTVFEKETRELRTQNMSSSDLTSLKAEDSFMYYSIPGVKRAIWGGRSVELQDVTSSRVVKRRTAISFESADLMDGFHVASMTAGGGDAYDDELLMSFYDMISDSEISDSE